MTDIRTCTSEQLTAWRHMTDERIHRIVYSPDMEIPAGTDVYYVSSDGCDSADGRTPQTAWKTLDKVNTADILPGSFVRFRRGDLWRGQIKAKTGVTYTAYGTGEKPKLYGSPEDGADPDKWFATDT